jgi:uncharacterized protein
VSVADVASDGPFSRFPGIDRSITLLEGNGFRLTRDDGVHVAIHAVGVPFSFHGEDGWTATLADGPVRDFNVMVDRAVLRAGVQVQQVPFRVHSQRWLVFALDGEIRVDGAGVPRWGLVDGQGPLEVAGTGRVLVTGLTRPTAPQSAPGGADGPNPPTEGPRSAGDPDRAR